MSPPIRIECPACGEPYFPTSQHETCPHDNITSFTRAMAEEIKRRLRGESP